MTQDNGWEQQVEKMARNMQYPPTPDIASAVREQLAVRPSSRRGTVISAAAILVILLAVMLAIPDIRAAALDFLQIGAVRIVEQEQSVFSAEQLAAEYNLTDPISLEDAKTRINFDIPTLPMPPDYVYLPDDFWLVLVWIQDEKPLRLYLTDSDGIVMKYVRSDDYELVFVNSRQAVWIDEPHMFELPFDSTYLVTDHILIWEADGMTYRLEGDISQADALTFAESIGNP